MKLLRRRCFPSRADHLPGLAARRRARPWSPDAGAPLLQPLPQAPPRPAAELRRRLRCVTPQPFPSLVSIPSASPFCCARRFRVWRTRGAPATLAGAVPPPPSRPCRRDPLSQPCTACPSPPVDYTCHGGAPRPNPGPNKPPERRIARRRRSPAAGTRLRRSAPPPPRPLLPGPPDEDPTA